jgi:homoserine dehydrogenase
MPEIKVAFLGFGNVGQALGRLFLQKQAEIQARYNLTYRATGIMTGRHGAALDPNGLDLERALALAAAGEDINQLSKAGSKYALDFIQRCGSEVLFENTPVNYASGQPAIQHLETALQAGMHAITANKGPVVHAYQHLSELAHQKGRRFFFESTVMDGAPIFSLFRGALPGSQLNSFKGILNSTTNLILTRMETGESFEQAVAYAQKIGIAETDPSGDVDGWDAAIKVSALVTVLMGIPLKPEQVNRTGIRDISQKMIQDASRQQLRYKLVCAAKREKDHVTARVAPELVAASSPLYSVEGTSSIVQFETDVLGPLSIVEADPGPDTTAYGLFADFLNAVLPA